MTFNTCVFWSTYRNLPSPHGLSQSLRSLRRSQAQGPRLTPTRKQNFRAVFCSIFVSFAWYFYSKTIYASFMHMIRKYCCSTMLLDKIETMQIRSDEIYPFSTCIFGQIFIGGLGDLQKTTRMWLQRWRPSYHSRLFRVHWYMPNKPVLLHKNNNK